MLLFIIAFKCILNVHWLIALVQKVLNFEIRSFFHFPTPKKSLRTNFLPSLTDMSFLIRTVRSIAFYWQVWTAYLWYSITMLIYLTTFAVYIQWVITNLIGSFGFRYHVKLKLETDLTLLLCVYTVVPPNSRNFLFPDFLIPAVFLVTIPLNSRGQNS